MKRSGKRLLAMLLCLTMALTLLPMSRLAERIDERSETPAEVAGQVAKAAGEVNEEAPGDFGVAAPMAATITPDGAVADTWTQTNSGLTESTIEVRNGKLYLKPGDSVSNNGDSDPGPAVFANTQLNAALVANSGETVITKNGGIVNV